MTKLNIGDFTLPDEVKETLIAMMEEELEEYNMAEKAKKWVRNYGIQYRIKMFGKNSDLNRPKKKLRYEIAAGGRSYTDGEMVRSALAEDWFDREEEDWVRYMKFVTAHEMGHVNWSDFHIFVDFQKRAESYFNKKYGIKGAGRFAGDMLNITEDGRIERAMVNALPGLMKYMKYVNGVEYESFPSNQLGIVPLHDFRNVSLTLSKVGLIPRGYDKRIVGSDADKAIKKAMPHIIKAIRSKTAKGCADATWDLIIDNEEFLAEAMKPFEMDEDLLQEMLSEDMSDNSDDSGDNGGEGSDSGGGSSDTSEETEDNGGDSGESGESDETGDESGESEESEGESSDGKDDADSKSSDGGEDKRKVTITPLDDIDGESDYKNKPSMGEAPQGDISAHFGEESDMEAGEAFSMSLEKSEGDEEGKTGNTLDELIVLTQEDSVDFLNKAKDAAARENDRIAREEAERSKTDVSDEEINGVLSEYKNGMRYKYTKEVFDDNGPIPEKIKTAGRGLRRDLKEIFNDKRGWTLPNQRSGMLDENQLYRAGAGLQQTDVFIKKQIPEDSNWVVSVLVDNSGSMNGSVHDELGAYLGPKTKVAREATAMLEIALNGLVPIKISRFDVIWSGSGIVQHAQVRGWEQKTKEILSWNSTDESGRGNADAMSIGVAVEELKKRPESKKLLIVLSDGLPAENTPEQVKRVIEKSRKDGIKIVGMGFGPENQLVKNEKTYRYMYDKDLVLTMPDGLSKELVKVLRATIARGN